MILPDPNFFFGEETTGGVSDGAALPVSCEVSSGFGSSVG
jgi:hypothetical protein